MYPGCAFCGGLATKKTIVNSHFFKVFEQSFDLCDPSVHVAGAARFGVRPDRARSRFFRFSLTGVRNLLRLW